MATDGEKSIFKVEPLSVTNYQTWAFKMKLILNEKECLDAVEGTVPDPITDAWMKMDKKAFGLIALGLSDPTELLMDVKSGRAAWIVLEEWHVRKSFPEKVRVVQQLHSLKFVDGDEMTDHLQKLNKLFGQLRNLGEPYSIDMTIAIVLASLTEFYATIRTSLEAAATGTLTLAYVQSKLIDECEKQKALTRSGNGEALKVNDRNMAGGIRRRLGARVNDERFVGSSERQPVICHKCGGEGHIRRSCPTLDAMRNGNKNYESAKMARFSEFYDNSFYGHGNLVSDSGFVIDSGATSHMCNDKSLFYSLDERRKGTITVADGELIESCGRGHVNVKIDNDKNPFDTRLSDVAYVPKLESNLLSVKKLTEKGFTVVFQDKHCFLVRDDDKILLKGYDNILLGIHDGSLYKMVEYKQKCYKTNENNRCIHDWHRILAHRNLADIRAMKAKGILDVTQCKCDDICESCIKGKMSRKSFPKQAKPVDNVLDCLVTDVCGPMQQASTSKCLYFVTFTDVHSKYCEVFFMKHKNEVYDYLVQYIERLKTQLGRKPMVVRSDQGKEYVNKRVQDFLVKEGIKFEYTVAYSPEQNGISERKNRTLVEAARSMLLESGLGKDLWAEAVNTANYIQNRISGRNNEKSPIEIMFNKSISRLDVHEFGTDVYAMIPAQKRRKLDDKAIKMKFIGYDSNSKGFRLLNRNHQVIISRDVKFLGTKLRWSEPWDELDLTMSHEEPDENVRSDSKAFDYFELNDSVKKVAIQPEPEENQDSDEESQDANEDDFVDAEELPEEPEGEIPIEPRRSERPNIGQRPHHLDDYVANTIEIRSDPKTYFEAMNSPDKYEWIAAMEEEIKSIESHNTWELTKLPTGRKAVGAKWVYKRKIDENGNVGRFKARLVAKGFTQKFGVDYDEVFAPVARATTLRFLLSVAGMRKLHVKHYDIKTAFLNGNLEEEIFIKAPKGSGHEGQILKLKKSLYGLKQAARVWNQMFHETLMKVGFVQSLNDKCLYKKTRGNSVIWTLIHVDDVVTSSNDVELESHTMREIGKIFELKDLGKAKHFLGIDLIRDESGNFSMSQSPYIQKIIDTAGLQDAKTSKYPLDIGYYKIEDDDKLETNEEYRKLIGMLLFLATNSRPDIAATVSILSQKITAPTRSDMNEVKRLIRYLKGTKHLKLSLSRNNEPETLIAYTDANWAEDKADRKSNSGFYCSFGNGAISWSCRKQDLVTLSSTEAEYVALSEACKELIWISRLGLDFNVSPDAPLLYTDNQSCMKMIKHDRFSHRTKHIDTKFHHFKDNIEKQLIKLDYVESKNNIADLMTKPLGGNKIEELRRLASVN